MFSTWAVHMVNQQFFFFLEGVAWVRSLLQVFVEAEDHPGPNLSRLVKLGSPWNDAERLFVVRRSGRLGEEALEIRKVLRGSARCYRSSACPDATLV